MSFRWDIIEKLAKAHHAEMDHISSIDSLRRFLTFWWCFTYNRPFKDPLLKEYTLEDLTYEYLRHHYTKNDPKKEEADKALKDDDEAWIKERLESMKKASEAKKEVPELKTEPKTGELEEGEIETKFE